MDHRVLAHYEGDVAPANLNPRIGATAALARRGARA